MRLKMPIGAFIKVAGSLKQHLCLGHRVCYWPRRNCLNSVTPDIQKLFCALCYVASWVTFRIFVWERLICRRFLWSSVREECGSCNRLSWSFVTGGSGTCRRLSWRDHETLPWQMSRENLAVAIAFLDDLSRESLAFAVDFLEEIIRLSIDSRQGIWQLQ